jgi:acyl dehydratase
MADAAPDRYFEEYTPGLVVEFGNYSVTEDEIIAFARAFDPQFFHTDPVAAKASIFGALVASGWHVGSMTMRMLVDHRISGSAALASAGMDEVRFHQPVRPGDVLSARVTVESAKPSQSKPDRGFVRMRVETINQTGTVVMSAIHLVLYRRRSHSL